MSLFPSNPKAVSINFDGVDKDHALILLMSYLADRRAMKYDPEVRELLTAVRSDGAPSPMKVKFTVQGESFTAPPDANANDVAKQIQDEMNSSLSGKVPMHTRIRVVGDQMLMSYEVIGFKYAPTVDWWMKNTLSLSQGNRYLFKIGTTAERLSVWASSVDAAGKPMLEAAMKSISNGADLVQKSLQYRLVTVAESWVEPGYKSVIKTLELRNAKLIANINSLRDAEIAAIKGISGLSPA
jgi:hypothetical protein